MNSSKKKKKQKRQAAEWIQLRLITTINWWFLSEWSGYFLQTPQPPHKDNKDWSAMFIKYLEKNVMKYDYKLKNDNIQLWKYQIWTSCISLHVVSFLVDIITILFYSIFIWIIFKVLYKLNSYTKHKLHLYLYVQITSLQKNSNVQKMKNMLPNLSFSKHIKKACNYTNQNLAKIPTEIIKEQSLLWLWPNPAILIPQLL